VSNCIFCGKPAGFLRNKHHQCAEAHETGRSLIRNLILNFLVSPISVEKTTSRIKQIAENSFVAETELRALSIDTWSAAVEQSLSRAMLTTDIERRLIELKDSLSLSWNDLARTAGWKRLVEAARDHITTFIQKFPL
jgi:hypothetical protein